MKNSLLNRCFAVLCFFLLTAVNSNAQRNAPPKLDATFSLSTLGYGFQAARPLTRRSDVRGGFNFFNFSQTSTRDGADYDARLKLRSIDVRYEQYLVAGLHVSGGALLWNGNKITSSVSIPGGNSFSLGNVTYFSDKNAPASGSAGVTFKKAAPAMLFGYGNIPKKGRIAYSVDAGIIFQGSPRSALALTGNVCTGVNTGCQAIATPAVQANVAAEQAKLNDDLSPFKYYPVIEFAIGYKFK